MEKMRLPGVRGLTAWCFLLLLCGFQAHAADSIPIAVFGRLPNLEDVVISPDGTKIAFVRTSGDIRSLIVAPLGKSEILGGARIGENQLRDLDWVDDDNLIITISSTSPPPFGFTGATREWFQLVNFNVAKLRATVESGPPPAMPV